MQLTPAQEEWLQALESGKYKQGTLRLKKDTPEGPVHCCLGVACELYLEKFPESLYVRKLDDGCDQGIVYQFDHEKVALPDQVREYLRLRDTMGTPSIFKYHDLHALWRLNDGAEAPQMDFCSIAKIIRETPEAYFIPFPDEEQSPAESSESSQSLPSPQS